MILGLWELPPGSFSRTLFVSFHFVSFLYCFCYFSFLCLENCPWKLSKDIKRSFFSNPFRFLSLCFFPFGYVSSFAFKIDLGNCQKALFLEPFSFCFRVFYFCFVFFRFFRFLFHVRLFFSVSFFHFIFHCDFCACLFSFSFLFSFFVWVKVYGCFPFFHVAVVSFLVFI